MFHNLDENLHTSGPNAGKHNFPSLRNYIHSLQENVKRFRQEQIIRLHLVQKPALKDAKCDNCHVKFKKHSF